MAVGDDTAVVVATVDVGAGVDGCDDDVFSTVVCVGGLLCPWLPPSVVVAKVVVV